MYKIVLVQVWSLSLGLISYPSYNILTQLNILNNMNHLKISKNSQKKPIIGDLEHSQEVHFLLVVAREWNKLMILRYHEEIAFASK